jgi:hypothetical protein
MLVLKFPTPRPGPVAPVIEIIDQRHVDSASAARSMISAENSQSCALSRQVGG